MGFTMPLSSDELKKIELILHRPPSTVEKTIFETMWSEHCSYKSTRHFLKQMPTKGDNVWVGVGEDAGIIYFHTHEGKEYGIVAAHESHNHPSQVLPVEGAATGVGGVVRDVYCMGADVIGVLNSLHFGINPENHLVQEIAENVVLGISDYANPLGVPVMGGETLYHPSYNDNCLVNVAALGLVEKEGMIHSFVPNEAKDTPYDVIIIGKSTDATGFGGAAFSSGILDQTVENIGAVQVHDPFMKRVIAEGLKVLFQEIKARQIKVGLKDLGAGGIACASSEIAASNGFGVHLNLDNVPVCISPLLPEVIACAETQERFCLCCPKSFTPIVLDIFNHQFELPNLYPQAGAAVIGEVVQNPFYTLSHQGEIVCQIPISAITTDVKIERPVGNKVILKEGADDSTLSHSLLEVIPKFLTQLNAKNKAYVYQKFDHSVKGYAVTYPFESDAGLSAPIPGCKAAVAASMDSNLYGHIDPYTSGAYAVAESVRNIIASGATPIALTDCLNFGSPENPDVLFDFDQSIKGISDAARHENLPIISGNVSLYNESRHQHAVIPSPVILCIGKLNHIAKVIPQKIRKQSTLFLIGKRQSQLGGTLIEPFLKNKPKIAPQVDFEKEKNQNQVLKELINLGYVHACHDISSGGLLLTLCEMLGYVGAKIHLPYEEIPFLFSENGGYVIATTQPKKVKRMLNFVYSLMIGHTINEPVLILEKSRNPVAHIPINKDFF